MQNIDHNFHNKNFVANVQRKVAHASCATEVGAASALTFCDRTHTSADVHVHGGVAVPPPGGSAGVRSPALGKNRDTPPSSPKNREFVRVATASRLMADHWNATGKNIKGSSVLGCGRWRKYGVNPDIAEIEVPAEGAPRMVDHFLCKATWACEHCGAIRAAQMRSWLRAELLPAMEKANLSGALVTFTLSHSYADDWAKVVDLLSDAFKRCDKRMAKWYKKVGSVGKVKALEAPIGLNGLHPHLHVLLTYKKGADLIGIESAMRAAWSKSVAELGGNVNNHGFDFKPDCANDYLAKRATAHELSAQGTKKSRGKGKLLGQVLDSAALGDKKASEEWIRAQIALGGSKRFQAGGLPKKLGITCPSKWEDEEHLSKLEAKKEALPEPVRITYPQCFHLKATGTGHKRPGLAIILRSARGANRQKVLATVKALCAEVVAFEARGGWRSFSDWTDEQFQAIVNEAGQRVLKPDEVSAYLEAKARGFVCKPKVSDRPNLAGRSWGEGRLSAGGDRGRSP